MKITRRNFIGLGLLGALGAGANAPAGLLGRKRKGPFTFAAINDLHVLDARSTAIVNRAVNQINADAHIEFTAVLGDVATGGELIELNLVKKSLERLERPCYVVPGNHDVEPGAANIYANYEKAFECCNWRYSDNDWAFIGLDSCEGAASDVSVQPNRMQWLYGQLRNVKRTRPIALFAHHPFNPNTKQYRVKNADEVLALFSSHNLKLVACGHWHGNQVERKDGVLFTTTACCSTTRTNFDGTEARGYRLFHLDGGEVTTEFVEVQA